MISYMLLNQSEVGFVSELQQNKTKQENATISAVSSSLFSGWLSEVFGQVIAL